MLNVVFYRFAWILAWLTAFAGFVYLLIVKIHELQSYPTNIDLNLDYSNSLPFPAVTVCNLNPYRLVACLTFSTIVCHCWRTLS